MNCFPPLILAVVLAGAGMVPAGAAEEAALVIRPGEYTEFTAPLNAEMQKFAAIDRPSTVTTALAAVAVPADFTPDRSWPVLFVSATSDPGYTSSRRLLRGFMEPALKAGWVVIAADAPEGSEDIDTSSRRFALILAACERLQAAWRGLPNWPLAFGGLSGGAKRSAWLAAIATKLGRRPIGVFQAGCNEATMSRALEVYQPARAQFLPIPVFLSTGRNDRIAPPDAVEDVVADLRHEGFSRVKLELFPGKHELYLPHVEQALRWFQEAAPAASRPAPATR